MHSQRRRALHWALGLLLLGIGLGQTSNPSTVPPDRSFDLAQYARLGMPALDHDWTADEKRQAIAVLQELAQSDPTRLPRLESRHSGELFQKLLYEEFDRPAGSNPDLLPTAEEMRGKGPLELAARLEQGTLLGVYSTLTRSSLLFDRELVASSARTLAGLRSQIARLDARPPTDANDLRLSRSRQMAGRSLLTTISILVRFSISPEFSPEARRDATVQLAAQVPQAEPLLSSEACQSLGRLLREASARKEADARLRDVALRCMP